ncbi:MAG: DUF1150 family protein [Acetobacteraceae bacterium]|nr:DUF1150 family protein [Acetobacteraceae bacterium]MBV9755929.1 DUF1150 family protein [Alphaproteobacteria bacterium]
MDVDANTKTAAAADEPASEGHVDIRHLSTGQLAKLGMAQIAYVKPIIVNGTAAFGIHAADGTPMAVAESHDVAVAAIMHHEMVAATLH